MFQNIILPLLILGIIVSIILYLIGPNQIKCYYCNNILIKQKLNEFKETGYLYKNEKVIKIFKCHIHGYKWLNNKHLNPHLFKN